MNDDAKLWANRVGEWQASGLSAAKFAVGRGYSAWGLYHWRRRLEGMKAVSHKQADVKIARVVRRDGAPGEQLAPVRPSEFGIIVEATDVVLRVHLPEFDRDVMRDVVAVLGAVSRAGAR